MNQYVIVDIGSGSIRAAVLNEKMQVLVSEQIKRQINICFDAEEEWKQVDSLLRKVITSGQHGVSKTAIRSIAVSALLGWVGVNKAGNPVTPCYSYMYQEISMYTEMSEKLEEMESFRICGRKPAAEWPAFLLAKIKKETPEIYQEIECLLTIKDYMNLKLTGIMGMDITSAGYTYLFDIQRCDWSKELLHFFEIDPRKVPQLYQPSEYIGRVTTELQKMWGVDSEIFVTEGSVDGSTAILGAGAYKQGMAVNVMGTTGVFFLAADTIPHCHEDIVINPHVIPGKWLIGGPMGMFGGTVEWLKIQAGGDERYVKKLTERSKEIPPGNHQICVFPALTGERTPFWNPEFTGAVVGIRREHGMEHILRGIMEAEGYTLRCILEIAEAMGVICKNIRVIGGGAVNDTWIQIKSDITGKIFERAKMMEATLYGSFYLCLLAEGKKLNELPEIQMDCSFEPEKGNQKIYDSFYKRYMLIHKKLKEIYSL